ncbi:MAG: hypothetical protein ACLP9L_28540 [Thermoguttaceae bacterium]
MSLEPTMIIATASTAGEAWAEARALAALVCVLFGAGAGMGDGMFFAHRHIEARQPFSL